MGRPDPALPHRARRGAEGPALHGRAAGGPGPGSSTATGRGRAGCRGRTGASPSAAPRAAGGGLSDEGPALDVVQRWFQAVVTSPGGVDAGIASAEAQRLVPLG